MATATTNEFRISVLPVGADGLLGRLPTIDDEDAAYAAQQLGTSGAVRLMVDRYGANELGNYSSKNDFGAGEFHSTSEGDELWTAYQMYLRLKDSEPQAAGPYYTRAQNLVSYYTDQWPDDAWAMSKQDPCNLDHVYGWGLKDWGEWEGDGAAFAVLESIALDVRDFLTQMNWYDGYRSAFSNGQRRWARLLRLAVAAGEVSANAEVLAFRDQVVENVMSSAQWDPGAGMYYYGENPTDGRFGAGAYAAGWRACSSFHIGMLADSMWQLYRVLLAGAQIGNWSATDVRDRIVAMADWVVAFGRDPNLPDGNPNSDSFETGASMGVQDDLVQHASASQSVYNISLVNMMVFAYKLTGSQPYLDRAWSHFLDTQHNWGNGQTTMRTTVDHYVDSLLSSSEGFEYHRVNKGELQYCYALFENGGYPITVR